jgi:hypothetical protein
LYVSRAKGGLTLIEANVESRQIRVGDAKLLAPTQREKASLTTFRENAGELSSRAPAAMIVLSSASTHDGDVETLGAYWTSKR